jgi:hypothetical protein
MEVKVVCCYSVCLFESLFYKHRFVVHAVWIMLIYNNYTLLKLLQYSYRIKYILTFTLITYYFTWISFSQVLLEELQVTQLLKNFSTFYEPKSSLPCLHEHAIGPYTEACEFSWYLLYYFSKMNFNIILPHLGLPSDLFPSGLLTKILYTLSLSFQFVVLHELHILLSLIIILIFRKKPCFWIISRKKKHVYQAWLIYILLHLRTNYSVEYLTVNTFIFHVTR